MHTGADSEDFVFKYSELDTMLFAAYAKLRSGKYRVDLLDQTARKETSFAEVDH